MANAWRPLHYYLCITVVLFSYEKKQSAFSARSPYIAFNWDTSSDLADMLEYVLTISESGTIQENVNCDANRSFEIDYLSE